MHRRLCNIGHPTAADLSFPSHLPPLASPQMVVSLVRGSHMRLPLPPPRAQDRRRCLGEDHGRAGEMPSSASAAAASNRPCKTEWADGSDNPRNRTLGHSGTSRRLAIHMPPRARRCRDHFEYPREDWPASDHWTLEQPPVSLLSSWPWRRGSFKRTQPLRPST